MRRAALHILAPARKAFRKAARSAAGTLAALGAALLCLSSCSVHEWPDTGTLALLKLDFSFATDLPPYLEIEYGTKTETSPEDSTPSCSCVRFLDLRRFRSISEVAAFIFFANVIKVSYICNL